MNPRRRHGKGLSMGGRISLKPGALLKDTVMPAAIGGASALAVDILWGFVPATMKSAIPAQFAPIAKIAAAVGVGWLAQKFAGPKIGKGILVGYITVTAYNFAKSMLQTAMPTLSLSEYPALGYVQAGPFLPDSGTMHGYVSGYVSGHPGPSYYDAGDADMVF